MLTMLMMLMMLIAMLRQGLAVQSRHLGRTTRINPPSYNPSWAPQGTASHISYLLAPPGPRALYAIKFTYFFHSMNVLHCPGLFWNSSWWLASKYKHATFAINGKSYLKFSTPLHPPSCNHCYAWFACPPPDSKMDIGLARLMEMSFMREYNPKYNHPATLCFGMKNKKKTFAHHIHLLLHWVQLGDIFFCSSKIWQKCEAAGVWNLPDSQKRILRISQHLETGSFWNITLWIFHNSMK